MDFRHADVRRKGRAHLATRIVLVDENSIMRTGLRQLLEQQLGMEVVAEADSRHTAVRMVLQHKPDLMIVDIAMSRNIIEAVRTIVSKAPAVKVIVLSMISDRRLVVEMLKAGAVGYLSKSHSTIDDLNRCINAVLSGRICLSPDITTRLVSDYLRRFPDDRSMYSLLTNREREVFHLLAEGKTAREAASRLFLSSKTVETHRRRIMAKLGVHSTVELLNYAAREGGLTSTRTSS